MAKTIKQRFALVISQRHVAAVEGKIHHLHLSYLLIELGKIRNHLHLANV